MAVLLPTKVVAIFRPLGGIAHTLEHLLDGSAVTHEGSGHLQTLGRDIAHASLDVVGDPLHEVGAVLVLHVEHLLVDLLGRHTATEQRRRGQVATVARVSSAHHVLGVEHLLGQLGHGQSTVLLRATRSQRSETAHEEVETRERDQVDTNLAQVSVELTRETQRAGDTAHDGAHQMVQVTEGWGGQLQGTEADVVQGLVVDAVHLIGVLHQLMNRQSRVVGLDDSIRHLGGGHDGEGAHDAVGVLLADLGDQQGAHTRASTTTKRVAELEALEAVTALGLLADNVQHGVDQLGTLGVVTLGPVVTGTSLAEHEVVRAEDLTVRAGTDGVHGTGLQIHEHSAGHVATASGLVHVHIDALQLEVGIAMVGTGGVHAVLVGDDLPELGTDLVTTLTTLDMHDLTHVF